MGIAARFSSRAFNKSLSLFVLLAALFFLLLGMLYRSFSHVDVVIDSIDNPAGTARMMERLEAFDADYRMQKDGSILVDGDEITRLMQEGVSFPDVRMETHRLAQAGLVLLLLATAALMLYVWQRHLVDAVGDGAAEANTDEAEHAAAEAAEPAQRAPEKGATASKLFEAEHPQTVAIYLLTLETDAAAGAMEIMDALQRERVWERMALSGECDGRLRDRVAELFDAKSQRLKKRMRPAEVTEKMVAIFQRLSPRTRDDLLSRMRREHTDAAMLAMLEAENRLKSGNKEA